MHSLHSIHYFVRLTLDSLYYIYYIIFVTLQSLKYIAFITLHSLYFIHDIAFITLNHDFALIHDFTMHKLYHRNSIVLFKMHLPQCINYSAVITYYSSQCIHHIDSWICNHHHIAFKPLYFIQWIQNNEIITLHSIQYIHYIAFIMLHSSHCINCISLIALH